MDLTISVVRLVTVPMASANSLLRWLAVLVLVSVMVVDGSDQSEVEALNDDVGKWEWVPDGCPPHPAISHLDCCMLPILYPCSKTCVTFGLRTLVSMLGVSSF